MIIDRAERHLVSNIAAIDGGAVWIFETESRRERKVQLSRAEVVSLADGGGRYFSVVHQHTYPAPPEVSAHQFANPQEAVSRIVIRDGLPVLEGDLGAWKELPRAYVTYYAVSDGDYPVPCLLLLDSSRRNAEIQRLDWYDESYYAASPSHNPRGPAAGTRRVSRGGAWRHANPWSAVAHRSSLPPLLRYSDYGIRLARDVGPADGAVPILMR